MRTANDMGDSNGVSMIARERERQIMSEGYSPEHDDKHANGEIANAAACYAMTPRAREQRLHRLWPWGREWWKPAINASMDAEARIRDLEKAGALCAAEIDRLLRLKS